MLIKWSSDLEIGNEAIDAQHRQLLDVLNGLVEACIRGDNIEKISGTLDFLVQYTVRHFADEEKLQIECSYPGYERHKGIHEAFKKTVAGLVQRYEDTGLSEELSSDLNKIVATWFVRHIGMEDRKIGEHIRESNTYAH